MWSCSAINTQMAHMILFEIRTDFRHTLGIDVIVDLVDKGRILLINGLKAFLNAVRIVTDLQKRRSK